MKVLRDLLIERKLFDGIRVKALKAEDWEEYAEKEIYLLEKNVLKRLRKKRSAKKYRKNGVNKTDLKEIIELADIVSLELFDGPSNSQIAADHPEWCNNCGRCCTESSPIFIHRDEMNPILTLNPDLDQEITRNNFYPDHYMFKQDKPCKFHDATLKRCKIYDSRPQVCRNYPLMMIGTGGKGHNIINLRYNCNYAISIVLEKSTLLFDEAIKRLEKK
jgi:Fe-S-cluster containining protein